MAKVNNLDFSQVRGKLNRKSNVIHRVRNGREHVYSVENPNTNEPSQAQKSHRSFFGKVNSTVNVIMADPEQVAQWTKRMEEVNRQINPNLPPYPKRFITTRQFVFDTISRQLQQTSKRKTTTPQSSFTLPKGVQLRIKPFSELTPAELYEILKARFNVFYLEQECQYPDLDDIDYAATHIALFRHGKVIAYARLFNALIKENQQPSSGNCFCIGRMLTTERGKGFGKYLMLRTLDEARRQGANTILIDAQTHAVGFYENLGFQTTSDVFIEAGIPHVQMQLQL